MSELIERARSIYESLPIADLKAAGIWPTRDYELVYNCPPFQALGPIKPEDIYSFDTQVNYGPKTAAIYVHIPYCQQICNYCPFVKSTIRRAPVTIDDYLELLEKEGQLLRQSGEMQNIRAQSLAVGGGTPSLLSPMRLKRLMNHLRSWIQGLEGEVELSIEGNPASISRPWLETALGLGFNRLAIGIQTFEDHLLKVCERPHNSRKAIAAFELARTTGFDNINVDLMFGLPGQTFEDLEHSLQALIQLQPASINCYRLRRHPQTVFGQWPDSAFPTPEDQLLMHIMAIEAICKGGYTPSHFENSFVFKPEFTAQQQDSKWKRDNELLGLGVGAYSYINGCLYFNPNQPEENEALEEYARLITANRLPMAVGRVLNRIELMHRWMMFGLMRLQLEQEPFRAKFGIKPSTVFSHHLEPMADLGLIEISDEAICLTKRGLLFPMEILSSFYTACDKAKLRAKGLRYGSYPR